MAGTRRAGDGSGSRAARLRGAAAGDAAAREAAAGDATGGDATAGGGKPAAPRRGRRAAATETAGAAGATALAADAKWTAPGAGAGGATGADAPKPAPAKTVATPWGSARLVDELSLPQEAGDRSFASLVQLLEAADGERLVRFAYATDGVARRGPVTLRRSDLARLRRELTAHEELRDALDA